jgi:hypothetical protein
MANLIASNIFKQLIYYPESALGVMQAETAATLTQPGSYTSAVGTKGEDELVLNFTNTTTEFPKGTKIIIGTATYYTVTAITSAARSTVTLILDRALQADVTTMTVGSLTYASVKTYIPRTLRRVSSNLDLKKETYSSNEIRSDQQIADQRTGANTVDGTISGELSSYTYNDFIGALLRKEFETTAPITAAANMAITVNSIAGVANLLAGGTLTWNAGDNAEFAKVKTGDIIMFKAFDANWNGKPVIVLNKDTVARQLLLTAATNPETFTAVAVAGATGVIEVLGKKSWIPLTNHIKKSFTFEHYYKDISDAAANNYPVSELFKGVRCTQGAIKMPSSGIATCDFTFMGTAAKSPSEITTDLAGNPLTWVKTSSMLQQITGDVPLDSGIDSIYSAAVGSIYIRDKKTGGTVTKVGLITSFDITINGNGQTLKVIGSTSSPDVSLGKIQVSGNMSIYFTDTTFRDMFLNEDEASIMAVFTENGDNSVNNSFMSFVMPRIKTGGATKDDAESIVMSVPFTALVGDGTNGYEATTISIQDFSQLA